MSNIFNEDRVGDRIWCNVEKDGVSKRWLVSWTHAKVGETTSVKITNPDMTISVVSGWTVVDVDV